MTKQVEYEVTGFRANPNSVTLLFKGISPVIVPSSNPNYKLILEKISKKDMVGIYDLAVSKPTVNVSAVTSSGKNITVELKGNSVLVNGMPLNNTLTNTIINTSNLGLPIDGLINFLKNVEEMPSSNVKERLFDFISSDDSFTITDDGCFLSYKKVRTDYMDIHSGTMRNKVGDAPFESNVDTNDNNLCSRGLHFCSYKYLNHFGSNDVNECRVMVVKVRPQDVVSIPKDYNDTKARCRTYLVVDEIHNYHNERIPVGVVSANPDTGVVRNVQINSAYQDLKSQVNMGFKKDVNGRWRDSLGRYLTREVIKKYNLS